jgi:hypothetical protein
MRQNGTFCIKTIFLTFERDLIVEQTVGDEAARVQNHIA